MGCYTIADCLYELYWVPYSLRGCPIDGAPMSQGGAEQARRAAANAGPGDGVAAVVASTTVARLANCSCWPPSSAAATNSFARPPCCPRSCCCPFSIASSLPSADATPGLATTVEVTHAGWRTRAGGVGASLRAAATPPVCDPPSDGGTVNVAHEGCTTCTAGLAGTTGGCSGPQLTRRGA